MNQHSRLFTQSLYSGQPKKHFCFRSSGCPLLKPVGRPHLLHYFFFFGLVGKYCPFLEEFFFFLQKWKKSPHSHLFKNHLAATPETEVFFSMASLKPPILIFPSPDFFQTAEKDEYEHQQKELEKVCMPIITKLYQAAGGAPGGMPGGFPGAGGAAGAGAGGAAPAGGAGGSGPTIEEVD